MWQAHFCSDLILLHFRYSLTALCWPRMMISLTVRAHFLLFIFFTLIPITIVLHLPHFLTPYTAATCSYSWQQTHLRNALPFGLTHSHSRDTLSCSSPSKVKYTDFLSLESCQSSCITYTCNLLKRLGHFPLPSSPLLIRVRNYSQTLHMFRALCLCRFDLSTCCDLHRANIFKFVPLLSSPPDTLLLF